MIKRGNLILAVLVCGVLPLLAAVVTSYWLAVRTNGEIQARAEHAILGKTRNHLAEIATAKRETIENHLKQIEFRLGDFAQQPEVASASESALNLGRFATVSFKQAVPGRKIDDKTNPMEQFEPLSRKYMQELRLSNVILCDIGNGKVIHSSKLAQNPIDQSKLSQLHKVFAVGNGFERGVAGLPFSGKVFRAEQLTYIGAPVLINGKPEALAVFEVSINRLGGLINEDKQTHESLLLVNHVQNMNDAIGPNDISSIATVDSDGWNLSVVSKVSKQQATSEMKAATDNAAVLSTVLLGGSQAAVLWTVLFVISAGTLIVNYIKQPLEQSAQELQQISLEGSGLLMDSNTNQNRLALLAWVNTVVDRVDGMISRFTGERSQISELAANAIAKSAAQETIFQSEHSRQVADDAMREIIHRSQQSLASATEAARLAEQAISKLGTNISPQEINDLRDVVTNITEQSKWLDENSTWMEEPVEYAK